MNILFLILSFIDNEFYLLIVGAFFVLPSLFPLICYIIENNKSIKSICNKDKNTYGYTLINNYSNILFLINKFIKNELI